FSKDVSVEDSEKFVRACLLPNYKGDISSLTHAFDVTDPNAREQLGISLAQGKIKDEVSILQKFNKPTLLIQGNFDQFINSDYLIKLRAEFDFNIVFEDFSHYPQVDDAKRFMILVQKFVNNIFLQRNEKDVVLLNSFSEGINWL